jgi:hypothetical protein
MKRRRRPIQYRLRAECARKDRDGALERTRVAFLPSAALEGFEPLNENEDARKAGFIPASLLLHHPNLYQPVVSRTREHILRTLPSRVLLVRLLPLLVLIPLVFATFECS